MYIYVTFIIQSTIIRTLYVLRFDRIQHIKVITDISEKQHIPSLVFFRVLNSLISHTHISFICHKVAVYASIKGGKYAVL